MSIKNRFIASYLVLAAGLMFAAFLSVHYFNKEQDINYYNKARVILTNDTNAINQGRYDDVKHDFYIINDKGYVIWSNIADTFVGMQLDINEQIQTDHAFNYHYNNKIKLAFAIKQGNSNVFAICIIDKALVQSESRAVRAVRLFSPFIIWGIIVIVYFMICGKYIKRRILSPIDTLTKSSVAIIDGNYDISNKNNALNGTPVGRLAYQFDLMADELNIKREREEQMKKSQKELLSCMSHDLRTPITTIKAHAEAIRDGLATTEERHNKYINTIIFKTDVVSKMISDLLDHSNAELNQLSINRTEVYVKEYIENIIKELEIYCMHCECSFESNNNIPEMIVEMDASRITQVIFNLVENAVKYMDKDDKKVLFKSWISSERMYISIKDNGPGISITDIPYLFDRFYRAEKSRSTQIPGAGLGLSICKYIVEYHKGEIYLESRTGESSEFTFYISLRK